MEILHCDFGIQVRAVGEASRSIDVVASNGAIDSYGEILAQDWDLTRYQRNPVVLFGHNSWDLPIGFASNVRVEEQHLMATLTFVDEKANPLAEKVWQGFQQKSLRAVSVGFTSKNAVPATVNGREVFMLSGNELLEISVVPMGANPEAVAVQRQKTFAIIKALARGPGETNMSTNLKAITAVLALADTASESEIVTTIRGMQGGSQELLSLTGKSTMQEAIGVVRGWQSGAESVPTLTSRVKGLEDSLESRDRDDLIARARAEGKLAPASVAWAKSASLSALKGFLETAPKIPQFTGGDVAEPGGGGVTLTHNNKSWGDMKPSEKHSLHDSNRALYDAMKADHERRNPT